MNSSSLDDLQKSARDTTAFKSLNDYRTICQAFLYFLATAPLTRIPSTSNANYVFYQYGENFDHKITRPLNTGLFIESAEDFQFTYGQFVAFLTDLKQYHEKAADRVENETFVVSRSINKVIYTIQQSIGCISDSFVNQNQARKRIGQLFEQFIILLLQEIGICCSSRRVRLPIPGYPGYQMSYELDLVFSRTEPTETQFIHPSEVVGSIKTTSKDRIDKIFLDKVLLGKLLNRNVPVIAIFLHDVQRANPFGINSTFKTNHFLGYTVALTKLDGVYYVDPRPEMGTNERLREQIRDFQQFLFSDVWTLTNQ